MFSWIPLPLTDLSQVLIQDEVEFTVEETRRATLTSTGSQVSETGAVVDANNNCAGLGQIGSGLALSSQSVPLCTTHLDFRVPFRPTLSEYRFSGRV